ncbi:MAG: response regulator [Gammaproteobacteria bacterium]|nr:response regulator [Gammaproteobacteria bacterium]
MNKPTHVILLTDDDAILRSILRKMLSNQGYRVIEAEDGASAIQAFRSGNPVPDLIVTDFEMPGCNGIALAREIGTRCPVILMSTE